MKGQRRYMCLSESFVGRSHLYTTVSLRNSIKLCTQRPTVIVGLFSSPSSSSSCESNSTCCDVFHFVLIIPAHAGMGTHNISLFKYSVRERRAHYTKESNHFLLSRIEYSNYSSFKVLWGFHFTSPPLSQQPSAQERLSALS